MQGLDHYLPLFVYGTLRRGMSNHQNFLAGRFSSMLPATLKGNLFLVAAENYPYLLEGRSMVAGELVFIKEELFRPTLEAIDRLEDFYPGQNRPSLYLRKRCRVRTPDHVWHDAWTYYWNGAPDNGKRIVSGDFCREVGISAESE